ncbi:hypothetical protein KIPB_003783, partial [Kipferlia bialata]|eukprot:g3783.t1
MLDIPRTIRGRERMRMKLACTFAAIRCFRLNPLFRDQYLLDKRVILLEEIAALRRDLDAKQEEYESLFGEEKKPEAKAVPEAPPVPAARPTPSAPPSVPARAPMTRINGTVGGMHGQNMGQRPMGMGGVPQMGGPPTAMGQMPHMNPLPSANAAPMVPQM